MTKKSLNSKWISWSGGYSCGPAPSATTGVLRESGKKEKKKFWIFVFETRRKTMVKLPF